MNFQNKLFNTFKNSVKFNAVDCGLHGDLLADGTCKCKDNYTGATCLNPPTGPVPTSCGIHGDMLANGTCSCRDNYTGATCGNPPVAQNNMMVTLCCTLCSLCIFAMFMMCMYKVFMK